MKLNIIDEKSGNPFPSELDIDTIPVLGSLPISNEGYYHNDSLIKDTTKKLVQIIRLTSGKKTIDVGYGSNLSVAEAMSETGMESYGLDSLDGLNHEKYISAFFVPPHFNEGQNGVRKYCGTIEELLHPESELKNKKFDLFIFWGSWDSGGYNFTIGGEMGEFRVREEDPTKDYSPEALYQTMQNNRQKILRDCISTLNPNGGILIVSSRYSGHGAGFTTEQLPWEKRINLRLIQNFNDLGAKETHLIGISQDDVQRQLKPYPQFKEVTKALSSDFILFNMDRKLHEAKYSPSLIQKIKKTKIPLGRIDAIYGKF